MAEVLLFNLVSEILVKLGSYAAEQFSLGREAKKELEKLKITMKTVSSVLLDAEEQQATNRAVKDWMKRLKDIVYDVDQLLDEFTTEALLKELETGGSMIKEVGYFFTKSNPVIVQYDLGRKTRDVKEKLDEVVADMKNFEFVIKIMEKPFQFQQREQTSSFVLASEIVGRKSDKEDIIRILSDVKPDKLVVLPVVGMGGLGKTTLAQLVYNDKWAINRFSYRLWVCVSDNFSIKTIIANILKASGDEMIDDKLDLGQLQTRLLEKLGDGNFFLVLDDIWNEDRVEWMKLRNFLTSGTGKSRILVTTRSKVVASITGTVSSYDIKGLSDKDCMSVLGKWAFQDGDFKNHGNLINIGSQIVKKCGGVPLAARSLGGFLYSKTDEKDWLSVKDSEIWMHVQKENDILPILKLSYDQMPSSLKHCFAYCSVLPKDHFIDKWKLIYLWIAQGFISNSNSNEELEVTGERYLDELVMRSFLQKDEEDDRPFYRMHDLVHDLAQYVAGSEIFCLRTKVPSIPDGIRHILISPDYSINESQLLKENKLRTILLSNLHPSKASEILSFKQVRALQISEADTAFFSFICKDMKHVRFLDLSTTHIDTIDFIVKLVNLQYLQLREYSHKNSSSETTVYELPENIVNLVSLRYLSIKLRSLKNLTVIMKLTSLRVLQIVDCVSLNSLPRGIRQLTFLRVLVIEGCRKLTSLPSGLNHLTALEHLSIIHCKNLKLSDEDLQGLTSLKFLELQGFSELKSLPNGIVKDSSTSLEHIRIRQCSQLTSLMESIKDFTSLQNLEIRSCESLLCLPVGIERVSTLKTLSITRSELLLDRYKEGGMGWLKICHIPHLHITD